MEGAIFGQNAFSNICLSIKMWHKTVRHFRKFQKHFFMNQSSPHIWFTCWQCLFLEEPASNTNHRPKLKSKQWRYYKSINQNFAPFKGCRCKRCLCICCRAMCTTILYLKVHTRWQKSGGTISYWKFLEFPDFNNGKTKMKACSAFRRAGSGIGSM